ncbi:DUF1667 domain-containing protein [Anaerococcus degeneri]|uniref:DUF1667 domain-containing protein n=1 Tax=Anaerococcus degeneri TaxID=361500 RepID=A0ABS7Z073_9FIRM|nr:DUF1667 domain-containing protein [Anaerococcus degeneri]MBP2016263.1 CxxC motif-containing protein [Anaerococcus degeneri]MCA2096734.1 DUF1667 domain-containing protein [Anaerococcus degeneri]
MIKELTCINCPLGCTVSVTVEDGQITNITGNTCKRGEVYARNELSNPVRVVTSTARVDGANQYSVSVKTEQPIPKGKIMEVMKEINKAHIPAPVQIGDCVIEDVAGTGIKVIATSKAS